MTAAARRILVVDDDEDIRTLVCLVLESEGYRPIPARDGLDALQILNEREPPSLILLDIMMPRMDGEELMSALKASAQLSTIPVIIMSGHNDAREKTQGCCVNACLVKPVDFDVLLSTVQQFTSLGA
jgi:two-component system, NtrC family, nitrogen regulation response regulator NtrX